MSSPRMHARTKPTCAISVVRVELDRSTEIFQNMKDMKRSHIRHLYQIVYRYKWAHDSRVRGLLSEAKAYATKIGFVLMIKVNSRRRGSGATENCAANLPLQ